MSESTISVLIPWRSDGERRQQIFDRLLPYWLESDLEICIGEDPGDKPFNICKALNAAREKATGDYFVVMGADHIPEPDHIKDVVEKMGTRMWAEPYRRRVVLIPEVTENILDGADPYDPDLPTVDTLQTGAYGILILRRDLWDSLGGRDERFEGRGSEDAAFQWVLTTLGGPPFRSYRKVKDLWHAKGGPSSQSNYNLLMTYKRARGNPRAMRAVISGNVPVEEGFEKMPNQTILVARKSAVVTLDGVRHNIRRNVTTAHANHPVVRGREDLFRTLVVDFPTETEEEAEQKQKAKRGRPASKKKTEEAKQETVDAVVEAGVSPEEAVDAVEGEGNSENEAKQE